MKILIVESRFYSEISDQLLLGAKKVLDAENISYEIVSVPGALEIPQAINIIINQQIPSNKKIEYDGFIALGCVIRGETSHYDLVSNETFRSLGQLALDYPDISIINGVICVDNKDQLEKRYITTTTNNANALIALINEKSSET